MSAPAPRKDDEKGLHKKPSSGRVALGLVLHGVVVVKWWRLDKVNSAKRGSYPARERASLALEAGEKALGELGGLGELHEDGELGFLLGDGPWNGFIEQEPHP